MQVRLASSSEADRIVAILQANFARDRLGYTIYGASGIATYIRDLIEHQDHGGSLWYVLVDGDGSVQGFAEIRRDAKSLFLNHTYVNAPSRGPGVGTTLLYHAVVHARNAGQNRATLDVFDDNPSVRRGHRALGFREVDEFCWLDVPTADQPRPEATWYAHGVGQADRVHHVYGFSEFSLETAEGTYRIGRLGDGLFRATDPAVLTDPVARKALASLDARRRLLSIASAKLLGSQLPGAVVRARAIRMAGEVDAVLESLGKFRAF